jgi:hypothetical protein
LGDQPAEPVGERRGLIERYRAITEEEGARGLRLRLAAIEDRLRYGAAERGERPFLHDELAKAREEGVLARDNGDSARPDLLLLTVGYSPEPLLLTVAFHAPRKVVLLVATSLLAADQREDSYESRLAVLWDSCREELGQPAYAEIARNEVRDSASAFFQAVRKIVEEQRSLGSSPRLLLDITGAKKTMVAGAFLAAGYLDVAVSYVDFDSYDILLRRPDPGSSSPCTLVHPIGLFRLREEARLAAAFDHRRFGEAAELATELAKAIDQPEVRAVLGAEEAARRQERYLAVAATARACDRWSSGFFRDAKEAFGEAGWFPVPPTVRLLEATWPAGTAGRDEIIKSLAEERVFADPSTALAYFLDVLVWTDEERLATRPRGAFLYLYGAVESVASYVFDAVSRRPEGLEVEPLRLAELVSRFPRKGAGEPIDWPGALRRGVVNQARTSSGIMLAALAGIPREVIPELKLRELLGRGAGAAKAEIASLELTTCRIVCRLREEDAKLAERALDDRNEFSRVRNKAAHWMAPVPHEEVLKLRRSFAQLLRDLIPIAVRELAPSLPPDSRPGDPLAELARWEELLLSAASGTIPDDCRPPLFEELQRALDAPAGRRPGAP